MDVVGKLDETPKRGVVVHLDRAWVKSYGAGTFEEALFELAYQARLAVEAHQVAISYLPDGEFLAGIHTTSLSDKYAKYRAYDVMPTGVGIWSCVVHLRLAVRMTDEELKSHPKWKDFSGLKDARGLEHPPMRGWLAVPILGQDGGFLGLLQATDKYDGDFTEDDLKEFAHVANLVAPTFELKYANRQLANRAEELEKRTAELDRVNEALEMSNLELKQFAYVASHDLQSPLRAIRGFAEFLQMDYQGKLDEKADRRLNRIIEGCGRMKKMIDDLLTFARVEARSQSFEPVELNDCFDDALEILIAALEESGAKVTRDELPRVMGDGAQLSQLLQNLIGNAVKYHGEAPPLVHVSAKKEGSFWTIGVRDNGIGIDPEFHERIFEIFHRLHAQSEYPGTGIGLAVCRRIAHRHGGKIRLDSTQGEGSAFYVTIPELVISDSSC